VRISRKTMNSRHMVSIARRWPNYAPRAASVRRPGSSKHLAHFFKHSVSHCGWQCNSSGCCLSLVDLSAAAALSCKQRYKSVNTMVWFYCYYCTTIYFNSIFLHTLCISNCIWPSSVQAVANSTLGSKSLATHAMELLGKIFSINPTLNRKR